MTYVYVISAEEDYARGCNPWCMLITGNGTNKGG